MGNQLLQTLVICLISALSFSIICFIISLILKRSDIADTFWGIGFIIIVISSFFTNRNLQLSNLIINTLVILWGVRLSYHIFSRNLKKEEDIRYIEMKKSWGKNFYIMSYLQIFLLQSLLMYIIALPIIISNSNIGNINFVTFLGFIVWLLGFIFESVGDWQLKNFIKKPENKGKIMTFGLWKYTRHPNYFGEVTMWWGIFLISINSGNWWLGILGPTTISFLILRVSGIPMTEKHFEGKLGWEEYKNKTSAFLPMIPKK